MSTYPGGHDPAIFPEPFSSAYRTHLQHLKLKGLQPKTIDAYARSIRRVGDYFDFAIDKLSPTQLTHYFSDLDPLEGRATVVACIRTAKG
jgi:hypothetical protein